MFNILIGVEPEPHCTWSLWTAAVAVNAPEYCIHRK